MRDQNEAIFLPYKQYPLGPLQGVSSESNSKFCSQQD